MKSRILTFVMLACISLLAPMLLSSCAQTSITSDKIGVAVSILPLVEFAESIGGDKVTVNVMVPPGASPHTYEPKPSQMTALANARLYVKVGSGIEFEISYMDKLASINKAMLVVDSSKGIDLMKSDDPDEPGMDPHIWTSPKNAVVMVKNICDGLGQIDSANKAYYKANRDAYIKKLTELDESIIKGLDSVKNRSFIIYHPAFGYFARDYNLTQIGIEQEGKEPTAAYVTHVTKEAKEKSCTVIFVSPQFSQKSAEVIAHEINGAVIPLDTLAKEYITNMEAIKDAMIKAMK
ncbi:MAG TPA: zinc ABC transporter substrate-binding protein [Dehalococcoidia bacterium]|nr:zinc ABC transporter substrate-binding protein [Dehalococcoidia bacterium]